MLGVGHLVRDIVVKRTQTWVLLEDLQPNTVYPIQVVAFNACGNSLPSDCSTILSECRTSSCPPDSPPPFKVISGTRKSIFLEGRLPYPYGTEITAIILEKRIMRPFLEGEWEDSMELMVPNDVEILNSTSSSSSSSILERGGHDLEGYEEEDSIASPYGQLVMDDKERLMQGSSTSSVERRDLPTKQTLKVPFNCVCVY